MASKRLQTEILFGGGWATDYGPTFSAGGPRIVVPFLLTAENIFFELDGGIHKVGGASKVNSVSLGSTTVIRGLYDFWRLGTTGSASQKRICHAGTVIYKEDLDGTWDSLFTGVSSTSVPAYTTFDDLLIIASDANEAPRSWDGTTAQNLAGTPPNFAFAVAHKKYVFAAGNIAFPSRLYYSAQEDPEDWTSASSGSLDILSNDGDAITGLYGDHKNRLWVFKGTNKGSIWQITGSSESDWAVVPFNRGIGCVSHNSIVHFGDDLAFVSDVGIHSLAATEAYGDFKEAFLSAPISKFFTGDTSELSPYRRKYIWGVNDRGRGTVLWAASHSGYAYNNLLIGLDYRFQPVRLLKRTFPNAACLAMVQHQGRSELWAGGYTGHAYRLNRTNRNNDAAAYTAKVTLPFLNLGSSAIEKDAAKVFIGLNSVGNYNLSFAYRRDGAAQQTVSISQAGADVLGPVTENEFTMDTSVLAGDQYAAQPADLEGSFRSIQFEVSNGTANQDLEIHDLGFHADVAGVSEVII